MGWRDFTPDWAEGAVSSVGKSLYEATPIDNVGNAYRAARSGDWNKFAKEAGIGLFETGLLLAPGGAALRAGTAAGKAAGRSTLSSVARSIPRASARTVFSNPARNMTSKTTRKTANLLGGSLAGRAAATSVFNRLLPGEQPRSEMDIRREGARALINGVTSGSLTNATLSSGPYKPSSSWGDIRSRVPGGMGSGRNGVTNDQVRSEVVASRGGGYGGGQAYSMPASTALPAVDPMFQAQLDSARSEALLALQQSENEADLRRRLASLQAQEGFRGAGRASTTQAADLRSIASEMGFGSSPAAYSVGLDQLASEEARQRAAVASELASTREQSKRGTERARTQYRSILDRLAREETAARSQAGLKAVMAQFGV